MYLGYGGINLEISDGTDIVNLFTALAQMDVPDAGLYGHHLDTRSRRSVGSENSLSSVLNAFVGCAVVFAVFGAILVRKRPRAMRAANNNRNEGIL